LIDFHWLLSVCLVPEGAALSPVTLTPHHPHPHPPVHLFPFTPSTPLHHPQMPRRAMLPAHSVCVCLYSCGWTLRSNAWLAGWLALSFHLLALTSGCLVRLLARLPACLWCLPCLYVCLLSCLAGRKYGWMVGWLVGVRAAYSVTHSCVFCLRERAALCCALVPIPTYIHTYIHTHYYHTCKSPWCVGCVVHPCRPPCDVM